jgi:hypothetical protein
MMKSKKLIEGPLSLTLEERGIIAESLVHFLHTPDPTIEAKWADLVRSRLQELRSGKFKPIPGDRVLSEILGRLSE